MTKYTYEKKVSSDRLTLEIKSSEITIVLDYIDTYYLDDAPYADLFFKAELSVAEKSILDTIIANHSGLPLPSDNVTLISPMTDEANRPYVRADSRDEHDTTYFTTIPDKWTAVAGESVGIGDGSTKTFYLNNKEVRGVKIYLDGVLQSSGFSVNYSTYDSTGTFTQFCTGKVVFTVAPSAGVVITSDYSYATIATDTDNQFVFNFDGDENTSKIIEFGFCDPAHIKDGVVYYSNGAQDSKMKVEVFCPVGNYYLDNSGTLHLASVDTTLQQYVVGIILDGNAEMGHYFDVEGRSKAIPNNYKLRVTIDKGSSVNLRGSLRLEINRERTIIL